MRCMLVSQKDESNLMPEITNPVLDAKLFYSCAAVRSILQRIIQQP